MTRFQSLVVTVAASFLFVSCATGYSITVVSITPVAVVLEYTHSVNGELQAAIQEAERRCQQYGKHARMSASGPVRLNMDRSVVTFDCVK